MPATLKPRDKSALLEKPREGRSFGRGGSVRRGFRGPRKENETVSEAPAQE